MRWWKILVVDIIFLDIKDDWPSEISIQCVMWGIRLCNPSLYLAQCAYHTCVYISVQSKLTNTNVAIICSQDLLNKKFIRTLPLKFTLLILQCISAPICNWNICLFETVTDLYVCAEFIILLVSIAHNIYCLLKYLYIIYFLESRVGCSLKLS